MAGGTGGLDGEFVISLFGKDFGLWGTKGFFLQGVGYDTAVFTLFLFQMVFMDTAATIPTGAMAERWKFSAFFIYAFFLSMISYPLFANWVWGGGWLSQLGKNFGLGHGHVDFAGSSVVHMVGGVTALAGALVLGPRIGKFNKDGTANAIPGTTSRWLSSARSSWPSAGSDSTRAARWPAPTFESASSPPTRCSLQLPGRIVAVLYMWCSLREARPQHGL